MNISAGRSKFWLPTLAVMLFLAGCHRTEPVKVQEIRPLMGTAVEMALEDDAAGADAGAEDGARGVLRQAQEAFYKVLDDYTLSDLLQPQQRLSDILFKPENKRWKISRVG